MTSARDKAAANEPQKPPGAYRAGEVLPSRTSPGGEGKLGLLDAAGGFHYLDDDGKIAKGKPRDLAGVITADIGLLAALAAGPEHLRKQATTLTELNTAWESMAAPKMIDESIPVLLHALANALDADRAPRMEEPAELGASVLAHSLSNLERRRFVRFAIGGEHRSNTWADGRDSYRWDEILDPQPWPMPEDPTAATRPQLASVPDEPAGEQP